MMGSLETETPHMKTCSKCQKEKPLSEFDKRKDTKDGRKYYCRDCGRALAAEQRQRRPDLESQRQRDYYKRNREAQIEKAARWARENRDRINERRRITGHGASERARYRSAQRQQTPQWANQEAIKRVYEMCARISRETGVEHHVDHIVPLQGRKVRGLHVEYNLQIIPGADNRSKGNKLTVG